jgi:hypothetical protein
MHYTWTVKDLLAVSEFNPKTCPPSFTQQWSEIAARMTIEAKERLKDSNVGFETRAALKKAIPRLNKMERELRSCQNQISS